jgi:hypothetical protein
LKKDRKKGQKNVSKPDRVTKAGKNRRPKRKSVATVVAEKLDAEEEPFIGPIQQKAPVVLERVYFVVKKVHRGRSEFNVAEHGRRIPEGFYEVLNSRTLHMSAAIKRKNDVGL